MPRNQIFSDNNRVVATHDTDDDHLPIGISVDDAPDGTHRWLSHDEALDLAASIQVALKSPLAATTIVNNFAEAPLASSISFNEALLRLAAIHDKTVTFRYAKGNGDVIETRTLKPEHVKEVAGHVTFTGYDPDRDEPRAYRVDRMKGEVSVA